MKRTSASKWLFGIALGVAFAVGASQTTRPALAGGATTCATKHCNASTHCCYGCNGGVFCVKNGVPCPECAPQ